MYPFTNNSNTVKTAYKIETSLIIQPPKELTTEPVTLGDHLRRRRLELGLYQKDVAVQIGVTTSSIWNWEHGWTIDLRFIPGIIEFIGYNPISCPDDLIDRLAWYKRINGLSLEDLGALMRRDPEQLGGWLNRRHKPCRRNLGDIAHFLSDHVENSGGIKVQTG